MNCRTSALLLSLLLAVRGTEGRAEEPYCGLYSVHAALRAIGCEIPFEPLVTAENLSGDPGSTAADLMRILRDNGCSPVFRTSMGIAELRRLRGPAILHTRPAMVRAKPRHWVAFLGVSNGMVQLYDPPAGLQTLRAAELMIQWDGTAIVLNESSVPFWWPNSEILLGMTISSVLVVLLSRCPPGRRFRLLPVVGATILAAIVWHSFTTYGFVDNRYAICTVLGHGHEATVPHQTIGSKELRELLLTDHVTLVDARRPDDYNHLHIEGAVNVPISSSHGSFKDALQAIPRSDRIVFYCQSSQCTWAERVANMFVAHGYDNVVIYSEGMSGWQQYAGGSERLVNASTSADASSAGSDI